MGFHSADTILCGINRFPGKHGTGLPKGQPLRLHCHSYLLVSPPSFELILSNVDGNLQIDETFAPRNAVDGVWANISHGKFPYQSWGTNKRDDAEWKLLHPIKDWAKINLLVQHCLNVSD